MTDNGQRSDLFRLLAFDDLQGLPDPPWLIDSLMPSSGLSVLYGPSGAGKSFLALDWAMGVAAGVPWLGREVEQRHVVYIAAEGRAGLKARAHAWWLEHGRPDVSRIRWLPEAVNLLEPAQVDRARRTLEALPARPGLLVIDTAARAMVGGDENAARDVGRFVAAVDGLRQADAALVVHHTGKDGSSERGSSALRGAADLMVRAERTGRRIKLACDKLKDAAEWTPITVHLEPAAGSCVLSLAVEAEQLDDLPTRVLAYIAEHGPTSGNQIEKNVHGSAADIREARKALERAGTIEENRSAGGWFVSNAQTRPDEVDEGRSVAPSSRWGEEDVVLPGGDEAHAQTAAPSSEPSSDDLGAEVFDLVARAERLAAEHADIAEAGP